MMAIIEAARAEDYPAEIALVISNRPKAAGLGRADAAGVDTLAIDHKDYDAREDFERALDKALREHAIEFIACAGFMRVLTPWFVNRWAGRMINIHPSLLPKYKGLHTHRRAIEADDDEAGVSVHWVASEVDGGAVIEQVCVPIENDETEASLSEKVLREELTLYPRALKSAIQSLS